MDRNTQEVPLRQRILSPLAAGFELVTGRWWLLLLPVALDLFLWLGPRLNIAPLWQQLIALLPEATVPAETLAQLMEAASATNLFALLSLPYLGVPVLMSGVLAPPLTPLETTSWPIEGDLATFGIGILLLGGGVLLAVRGGQVDDTVCGEAVGDHHGVKPVIEALAPGLLRHVFEQL